MVALDLSTIDVTRAHRKYLLVAYETRRDHLLSTSKTPSRIEQTLHRISIGKVHKEGSRRRSVLKYRKN